jgi:hypothetical protein
MFPSLKGSGNWLEITMGCVFWGSNMHCCMEFCLFVPKALTGSIRKLGQMFMLSPSGRVQIVVSTPLVPLVEQTLEQKAAGDTPRHPPLAISSAPVVVLSWRRGSGGHPECTPSYLWCQCLLTLCRGWGRRRTRGVAPEYTPSGAMRRTPSRSLWSSAPSRASTLCALQTAALHAALLFPTQDASTCRSLPALPTVP